MTEGPRKLLIVEDDPGIQNQLRWCFEDYDVVVAADRSTAIAELRRHEPPVVLQDLGLPPDDSGVEEGFATLFVGFDFFFLESVRAFRIASPSPTCPLQPRGSR